MTIPLSAFWFIEHQIWFELKLFKPLVLSCPFRFWYSLRVLLLRNASAIALEWWQCNAVVILDNWTARILLIPPLACCVTVSKAVDLCALVSYLLGGVMFTHPAKHFEELLMWKALSVEVRNSLPDRPQSKVGSQFLFKVLFFCTFESEWNVPFNIC